MVVVATSWQKLPCPALRLPAPCLPPLPRGQRRAVATTISCFQLANQTFSQTPKKKKKKQRLTVPAQAPQSARTTRNSRGLRSPAASSSRPLGDSVRVSRRRSSGSGSRRTTNFVSRARLPLVSIALVRSGRYTRRKELRRLTVLSLIDSPPPLPVPPPLTPPPPPPLRSQDRPSTLRRSFSPRPPHSWGRDAASRREIRADKPGT